MDIICIEIMIITRFSFCLRVHPESPLFFAVNMVCVHVMVILKMLREQIFLCNSFTIKQFGIVVSGFNIVFPIGKIFKN